MTKLIVNSIDSRSTSTEFKDIITANHSKQWLDTYGVIKAFKNTIDENVTTTYYADNDGDGFGDENNTIGACEPTFGYVSNSDDCDDVDCVSINVVPFDGSVIC